VHQFTAAPPALRWAVPTRAAPGWYGALHLPRPVPQRPAAACLRQTGDLAELDECWEIQGAVDRAGGIAAGYLRDGGDPARLIGTLGHALLREDAEFHWYQVFEAGVAEFYSWPIGSEEGVLILAGLARFLAAHTPTRRELSRVVDIAARLRRGEELYEES
jgi:hypothetical protein